MMRLNNNVVNNLANVTPNQTVCATTALSNVNSSGNSVIQTQAANVCIKKDLSNLTAAQKHAVVDLCAPSGTVVQMTAPTSSGTTFTAGSTGWVLMGGFAIIDSSHTYSNMIITASALGQTASSQQNHQSYYVSLPVVRGQTVSLYYINVASTNSATIPNKPSMLKFIQAGGG